MVLKGKGMQRVLDLMPCSGNTEECRCPGQRAPRSEEQDPAGALSPSMGPLGLWLIARVGTRD